MHWVRTVRHVWWLQSVGPVLSSCFDRGWAILSQQPTIFFCVFSRMTQVGWVDGAVHDLEAAKFQGSLISGLCYSVAVVSGFLATPWTAAGVGHTHWIHQPHLQIQLIQPPLELLHCWWVSCNWNTGHVDGRRGWGGVVFEMGVSRVIWWIVRVEAEGKEKNYGSPQVPNVDDCMHSLLSEYLCWAPT